jgi:hypothetical protein
MVRMVKRRPLFVPNNGSDVSPLTVLSFPRERESKFRQSMAGCPHRGHDRSDRTSESRENGETKWRLSP